MMSVELFAGCGGLALGLARAGFQHCLIVEYDQDASDTLQSNRKRGVRHFKDWPLEQLDVRDVDYSKIRKSVDLVAGGPPCQPFSIGGKHGGPEDVRNMWPQAVRAVSELRPRGFLFENVRGLLRPAFGNYLAYLKLTLSWPSLAAKKGERWQDHCARLAQHAKTKASSEPEYLVEIHGINAADYGAPQKRHRAMIMGIRTDICATWTFPGRTHSREALVWDQCVSGDYWERHEIAKSKRGALMDYSENVVAQVKRRPRPAENPWMTVRDAIGDLPIPLLKSEQIPNHRLHPGARIYPRHTGSRWDEPAKALKAGHHGVPGGENILAPGDGTCRYFTLREMARLQGFPDQFVIGGTWKAPIKQLGNAVPVSIGEVFGDKIIGILEAAGHRKPQTAA